MSPDILKGKESGCFLCPIFYVLGANGKELRRHGKSCYPFLSFCPTYICPSKNDTTSIRAILHSLDDKNCSISNYYLSSQHA